MPTRVRPAQGFVRTLRRDPGPLPERLCWLSLLPCPHYSVGDPARAGARCWHALDQREKDSQGLRSGRDGPRRHSHRAAGFPAGDSPLFLRLLLLVCSSGTQTHRDLRRVFPWLVVKEEELQIWAPGA